MLLHRTILTSLWLLMIQQNITRPNHLPHPMQHTFKLKPKLRIKTNMKLLDSAAEELKIISGQKPVITRAKRSIAAFKLREGMPIGCMVSLRHSRMYDFFNKLVNIALPRVRDFRGISGKAFDGRGNYTLGIKEHIIFPEIDYDSIDRIKGLNITVVTTAKTDEEGKELLKLLGMPFRN